MQQFSPSATPLGPGPLVGIAEIDLVLKFLNLRTAIEDPADPPGSVPITERTHSDFLLRQDNRTMRVHVVLCGGL